MQVILVWDVTSCDCNVIVKSLRIVKTADSYVCTTALHISYFCMCLSFRLVK